MKPLSPRSLITLTSLALGSLILSSQASQAQPAPGQRGFWCGNHNGVPATLYQNSQGGRELWINWRSHVFTEAGYDPLTRCQQVSARLENYRQARSLRYVTVGIMNGQRVMCTASQVNGRCENLVYTLRPGQDAVRTLHNFLALREGQLGAPALNESGSIPYIDVGSILDADEARATANPTVSPLPAPRQTYQPSTPANPQPVSSGGMREL